MQLAFRSRIEAALFGAAVTALLGSLVLSRAHLAAAPIFCPVRRFTGHLCPACGLTRSFVAMGHGDVAAAFAVHPFGPIAFAIAVAFVAIKLVELARSRLLLSAAHLRALRAAGFALLAVWLPWGAWRLLAG